MKIDKSLLAGSTTLLILNLLSSEDMYGYQMVKELSLRSDDTFELKEGTLYPILHALEKQNMLKSYESSIDGRRRKYYKITRGGLCELEARKEEWTHFSKAVNQVVFPLMSPTFSGNRCSEILQI